MVTNPIAGTLSESTIAVQIPEKPVVFSVQRFAKPEAAGPALTTRLLQDQEMQTLVSIARVVEKAYCKAKPGFYVGRCEDVNFDPEKPKSLDFEFKHLENGHFVAKQVREFAGK